MKLKIAVLSGDGIGPEVTAQTQKCLTAVADIFGHDFSFKKALVGAIAIEKSDSPLPQKA